MAQEYELPPSFPRGPNNPYAVVRANASVHGPLYQRRGTVDVHRPEFDVNAMPQEPSSVPGFIRSGSKGRIGPCPQHCPTLNKDHIVGFEVRGSLVVDEHATGRAPVTTNIPKEFLKEAFDKMGVAIGERGFHFVPVEIVMTAMVGPVLNTNFLAQIELSTAETTWSGGRVSHKDYDHGGDFHNSVWNSADQAKPVRIYEINPSKLSCERLRWLPVSEDTLRYQLGALHGDSIKEFVVPPNLDIIRSPFEDLVTHNVNRLGPDELKTKSQYDPQRMAFKICTQKAENEIQDLIKFTAQRDLCMNLNSGIEVRMTPAMGTWEDVRKNCASNVTSARGATWTYTFYIVIEGVPWWDSPSKYS